MKKLLILCVAMVAVVAMVACEKDNNGKLDPNAMISLRPAQGVKAAAENTEHLTALEIVKQAINMRWYNKEISKNPIGRTFADHQHDVPNVRLLMYGTDIISQEGNYNTVFIEGEDVIIDRWNEETNAIDTIAFVPNQVLRDADKLIKEAYDKGDYATCYALFDQAFTFQPITGEEWRNLSSH